MAESISCKDAREGLTEYLDQALSSSRRRGYETHFRECPACRDLLTRTEALIRKMSELPREPMPVDLKSALVSAFRQPNPSSRSPFPPALAGTAHRESE